ncbi:MAG: hypothetical protein ACN4E2_00625 [Nitrospinota bacterium]
MCDRRACKFRVSSILTIITVIVTATAGCVAERSSYNYWYDYRLVTPSNLTSNQYEDDILKIDFYPEPKRIVYNLENRHSMPIKIDYSRSVIIDTRQRRLEATDGLLYFKEEGVKKDYLIIEPNQKIVSFIVPTQNISKLGEWTWSIEPMFDLKSSAAIKNKGSLFGVELFITSDGAERNYIFEFEVREVVPIKQRLRY